MKRRDLIQHFETYGCQLLPEGGKHNLYFNSSNNETRAVPGIARPTSFSFRRHAVILGFRNPRRRNEPPQADSAVIASSTTDPFLTGVVAGVLGVVSYTAANICLR